MAVDQHNRFERLLMAQSTSAMRPGDVVELDAAGAGSQLAMTVLEISPERDLALCVWHAQCGAPHRAPFELIRLNRIDRRPSGVNPSLRFDAEIAGVVQHPALGVRLRSGGAVMSGLVQYDIPDLEMVSDEKLLRLSVSCNWHDDAGDLRVEHYPLVALTGAAA